MCWKNVPVSLRSGAVEPRGRSVLRRLFITLGLVAVTCAAAGMQQLSGRVVAVIGITREIAPVEARLQSPTIERIRDPQVSRYAADRWARRLHPDVGRHQECFN